MAENKSGSSGGKKWLRAFLVFGLILVVIPALYFFVYVDRRVDAANRHAYDVLAAVASDLKARIRDHEKIAENAAKSPDPETFLRSLPEVDVRVAESVSHAPALLALPSGASGTLDLQVQPPKGKVITAKVPFKNLISWYLVNSEFDGLLVFDATKYRLIAQDRRLPEQSLGEQIRLQRGEQQMTLDELLNGKGAQEIATSSVLQRNEWFVRVAGVDYRPFVQRLVVPISPAQDAAAGEISVVVMGLIAKQRFWRDAVALSPGTFVRTVALLALAILMIPFLKLRFIGRSERMRQSDIWLLGASVPLASALLVLLVLHEYTSSLLRQRFDEDLRLFGTSIQRHVDEELQAIRTQFRQESLVRALFTDASGDRTASPDAAHGSILTQVQLRYPLLEAMFLTGPDGQQLAKVMARTIPTAMVDVSALKYFRNTLALQVRPDMATRDVVAFTPDTAITSGLRLGIVSLPSSRGNFQGPARVSMEQLAGPQLPERQRDGILAVATPMPSLNAAIVTRPFQFVVLERGSVVFQAASGPYLGERFYDHVTNGSQLLHAAQLVAEPESPRIQSFQYHGGTYRMLPIRMRQLADPAGRDPIDVVVFYDEHHVQVLAAQAFAAGAGLALAAIAAMLLSAFLAVTFFRGDALSWAWPSVSRVRWYAVGIVAAAILMLLILRIVSSSGLAVRCLLVAAPGLALFVAGGLSWAWSNFRVPNPGARPLLLSARVARRIYEPLFNAFGVVALLVLAALPAAIAFDQSLGYFTATFETANAEQLESDWLGRDPLRDQLVTEQKDASAITGSFSAARLTTPCMNQAGGALPPGSDFRCQTSERIYADPDNFKLFNDKELLLRRYDDCVDLRLGGRCECLEKKCGIQPRPENSAAIGADPRSWLDPFSSGSGALADLKSRSSSAGLWWGLALVVVIVGALVRSVATHVLGLHMSDRLAVQQQETAEMVSGCLWLLLRPPSRVLRRLERQAGVRSVDLSDPQLTLDEFRSIGGSGANLLLVKHLESHLHDREWRKVLCDLLRVRGQRGVALSSEIDPYYYFAQQLREMAASLAGLPAAEAKAAREQLAQAQEEVSSWSGILLDLEKKRYGARAMWRLRRTSSRCRDRLCAFIRAECSSSEHLRRIGAGLLRRSDLEEFDRDELVRVVLDVAEPYYRSLWDLCSSEEKLVLIQLAEEGLVNPKKIDVMRRLARRCLVTTDPSFGIINESFAQFVREAELPEWVQQCESRSATWRQIATPLYLLAAVAVALLLVTEQTLVTNVMAIAAGAAGALGSIRTLVAQVRPPSAAPTKSA